MENTHEEMEKFPYKKTALLSFGMFASNIALSVFVIYVPLFVRRNFITFFGDNSMINTVVGIVMVLDNVVALFIQPYVGTVSDRIWVKKLGRRMPFIVVGIPLAAFFLGLIGTYENTLLMLLISITMFNIAMAVFKSPVLALIPDFLPPSYRSEGSGVLSVVGGLASILGLFISAYLYEIKHALAFWVVGGIMIGCLIILIFNVREDPDNYVKSKKNPLGWGGIIKNLRKENDKALIFTLVAVFFNQCGYQVAETFLSTYTVTVLGFSETQANYVLATLFIFGIMVAIPAGLLGKKIGARDAALIGLVLFFLSTIPIAYFSIISPATVRNIFSLNQFQVGTTFFLILALVVILGFSLTLVSINLLVVIWDMASKNRIATFTGYYYLFAHSAAILSPFLAGLIFDGLETLFPINGLQGLFGYVSIMYIGAIYALFKVRKIQKEHEKSLSTDEQQSLITKTKTRDTLLLPWILFGVAMRRNPVKVKRKALKKDLQMFEREFKEFLKDGDLTKKQYREAIRALKREHKLEIKALKRELVREEIQEDQKKATLDDDLKLFAREFREFMEDGDLSKSQFRQAIRALKKEHKKDMVAYKQKLAARREGKRWKNPIKKKKKTSTQAKTEAEGS
ncbi:MAG: MFS transporter [Promethearchaeota archaeon]